MKQEQAPKIVIVGLGPVGSILAVMLAQAGCSVSLVVRNKVRRELIASNGLNLEHALEGAATFSAVYPDLKAMDGQSPDYLIFAVKAFQLPAALEEASALNLDKSIIVSAQNGIDVEQQIADVFGESRTLRMVVNFAGALTSLNTVKVTFFISPNYVGAMQESSMPAAQRLAQWMTQAQLETQAVSNQEILWRVWEKTILNSSISALCGVSHMTMAEVMAEADSVELVEQVIREAVLVAEEEKYRFPDDFLRRCLQYLKKAGDHFPSLALDLIHHRPTEIDYFNGKIVNYGRKHYIRTSLNLAFTNMVKAMSNKNTQQRIPGNEQSQHRRILKKGLVIADSLPGGKINQGCTLGIDLGSAFSKLVVINQDHQILFRYVIPSTSGDHPSLQMVMDALSNHFDIKYTCATGYGRKHFQETDMIKTEINCAATAVSYYYPGEKNILDIGGEDIKVIRCGADNKVEHFSMNDKCAAGTGSFLAEISDRAELPVSEMSRLAALSDYDAALNSFCTVFAKTEIMNWIFEGRSKEDMARGIYLSIASKVAKMRLDPGVPTYMIGGVALHHPYLITLLAEKYQKEILPVESSQFVTAFGAALMAAMEYRKLYTGPRQQPPDEQPLKEVLKQ